MIMNWKVLFVFLVCLCLILDVATSEKHKKKRKNKLKKWRQKELEKLAETLQETERIEEEIQEKIREVQNDDENAEDEDSSEDDEIEEVETETDLQEAEEEENTIEDDSPIIEDPCAKHHCGAGKECKIGDDGGVSCQCIDDCPLENDNRRKTCSNHNETWAGDCVLHQMRCWCRTDDPRCSNPKYKHLHIDYYGECQELQPCLQSEMQEFPKRMREWLFNVMRDLADRKELSSHYVQLERESEDIDDDQDLKWANAVIWKWCDLDGHPRDNAVSRHELFPIRAPLVALEHCISPFLDGCDQDKDHHISLAEWGKCLHIPEDVLEDKCEKITEN